MPPPPKPPDQRRRRNTTGVKPDHTLSPEGRKGRAPNCPLPLGDAGTEFWSWVWHTPQATMFTSGDIYALAMAACTIDDYVTVRSAPLLCNECGGEPYRVDATRLAKLSMDYFDRFGLSPKAMAALHWFIAPEKTEAKPAPDATKEGVTDIRSRLRGTGT